MTTLPPTTIPDSYTGRCPDGTFPAHSPPNAPPKSRPNTNTPAPPYARTPPAADTPTWPWRGGEARTRR